MVNKNKLSVSLNLIVLLAILYSCGTPNKLSSIYCSDISGVNYSIKIDTGEKCFEYVFVGGLANDTIIGKYDNTKDKLILRPYEASVATEGDQVQVDYNITVIDGKTDKEIDNYVIERVDSGGIVFTTAANVSIGDTIRISHPSYGSTNQFEVRPVNYRITIYRSFREGGTLILKKRGNKLKYDKLFLHPMNS
jgi:hypothetical protein